MRDGNLAVRVGLREFGIQMALRYNDAENLPGVSPKSSCRMRSRSNSNLESTIKRSKKLVTIYDEPFFPLPALYCYTSSIK